MDINGIIRELLNEHKRLDRTISRLEQQRSGGGDPALRPKKRGRKFMDSAGRREVSERMRRYWARQRELKAAAAASDPAAPTPGPVEQAQGPVEKSRAQAA